MKPTGRGRRRNWLPHWAPSASHQGKRRCRKHGGAGGGAPVGNKNIRKHGAYSAETKARRRAVMDYVRACNRVMKA